jgi:hypothetical protein
MSKKVLVSQSGNVSVKPVVIEQTEEALISCPLTTREHLEKFGKKMTFSTLREFGFYGKTKQVCGVCKRCDEAAKTASQQESSSICNKMRRDMSALTVNKSVNCPLSA